MAEIQDQLRSHVAAMDPEALMKTWMPMGTKAFETFRDAFVQGFQKRSSE